MSQEQYLDTVQHCVSVFGKMPEQCLRLTVIPWCAEYAAGAMDISFVEGAGPELDVRHFLAAVDLYETSISQELLLMDVADVAPLGLLNMPLSLVRSEHCPSFSSGYGMGGAMVQGSKKSDRDIARMTLLAPGREEIRLRVSHSCKQLNVTNGQKTYFLVQKNQWESVMAALAGGWPGLGHLHGRGTSQCRFVFQDWARRRVM